MDRMKRSATASPLMIAVGPKDKENFSGPDVIHKSKSASGGLKKKGFLKSNSKVSNKNIEMIKNQMNNVATEQKATKKAITAEDLTTTDNPSEGYWEQLSESRRIALEATWKENFELHSRVMELEYENTKLKAMLAEAKTSIQLLTELVGEDESDSESPFGETSGPAPTDTDLDDSIEDASFTSI